VNVHRARIILAAVKLWDEALQRVRTDTNYGEGWTDEPLKDEVAVEVAEELALAWIGVEVALRLSDAAEEEAREPEDWLNQEKLA
jgi:hypothetical protein